MRNPFAVFLIDQIASTSASGTRLVAADMGGRLYTSTDAGMTWTARASTATWWSVASSVKRPLFYCSFAPVFRQFNRICAQTTAEVQRQSPQRSMGSLL